MADDQDEKPRRVPDYGLGEPANTQEDIRRKFQSTAGRFHERNREAAKKRYDWHPAEERRWERHRLLQDLRENRRRSLSAAVDDAAAPRLSRSAARIDRDSEGVQRYLMMYGGELTAASAASAALPALFTQTKTSQLGLAATGVHAKVFDAVQPKLVHVVPSYVHHLY